MKVTLQSCYGEHPIVAQYEGTKAPELGDHFHVRKRNGKGFSRTTYKVVSRFFDVVIDQREGGGGGAGGARNDETPGPTKLEGVTCKVAVQPESHE